MKRRGEGVGGWVGGLQASAGVRKERGRRRWGCGFYVSRGVFETFVSLFQVRVLVCSQTLGGAQRL